MKLPQYAIKVSYDYAEIISSFKKQAQNYLGRDLIITPQEQGIIFGIIAWMLQDELVAQEMNFDLKKGILLTGPIGCGKTTLFKLLKKCKFPKAQFRMVSTRQIVSEFMKDGYEILDKYSGDISKPTEYCFDDLGLETSSKYFGNECNVMAEILLTRYDLFKEKGIVTHLTTNLSATEIESQYGNRLRSRMREMFNLFGYEEGAKDKRK